MLAIAGLWDAIFGYPDWLYRRVRHPVVWMGACITFLERYFNPPHASFMARRILGLLSLIILLTIMYNAASLIHQLSTRFTYAWFIEMLCIAALLAQRSLYNHVGEVRDALRGYHISLARDKLRRIVGRDVETLDEAGISRAAIESLAESFSDGVVAPLFWAACLGLPGIVVYKAINTADSMIGHKDERYHAYGWAAARFDDAANAIPARLSALLFLCAAWLVDGSSSRGAWRCVIRDAHKHASPNAGWPEAAMAGALGLTLGGPQSYDGVQNEAAYMGDGTRDATVVHIDQALKLYVAACGLLWLMLLCLIGVRP